MRLDRVERLNLTLSAGAVAASLALTTPHFTISLAVGAALEAVNFRALRRVGKALVSGELVAAGFGTVPITTPARAVLILQAKVTSRVAGIVERAYASGTDLEGEDIGEDLTDEFDEFLEQLRTDPTRVGAMLGVALGGTGGSRIRSYPTDLASADGKSIDAGDFDPEFDRDTEF